MSANDIDLVVGAVWIVVGVIVAFRGFKLKALPDAPRCKCCGKVL